ncbi:peptide-methionine (R)-S-oxide reductase MsrB [Fibrella aquatilis]|uniref:peptide-methionine (R)-S-oxide reductase n=1 Tax=Fibrella aquatilis TaxID=2817059 RepID=A0A939G2R5_9BACT|nr:peptide-methionine (R)-S-oxide reductase MsrB [Fibrella aquatilis]MBO0931257.1 peptide-methionine (R)-S-oxide reductase MsrB [Fibrella aquatilis]
MNQNKLFLLLALLLGGGIWLYGTYFATPRPPHQRPPGATSPGGRRMTKTDADWRIHLTQAQYAVLRESHTEWPNSSDLTHEKRAGIYVCAGCRNPLFSSKTKFDSNTGWPSFFAPIVPNAIYTEPDGNRTEVRCAVCDGHLGHVFPDGPEPSGLRYCMNGDAMVFEK